MARRGVLILLLALLGACGDGDDDTAEEPTSTTAPTQSQSNGTSAVTVQNSSFAPPAVAVKAGEKVVWTFRDSFSHTVTADDGSFDSGSKSSGATFERTFSTAGTFKYKCNIHSSMTGTVTVS